MPTLDQGNQQAKPYNDYLESLKTLRSQIPPLRRLSDSITISSGTVMQAPMMTPQSPFDTNQPQITYPTVGIHLHGRLRMLCRLRCSRGCRLTVCSYS